MIVFEVAVVLIIIGIQYVFFLKTRKQLKELEVLFPAFPLTEKNLGKGIFGDFVFDKIEISDFQNQDFQNIITATNSYLRKNKGSADFNIIKSVSERVVESQESAVTSNIALPLYIGLMSTFFGVIIGLVNLILKPQFGSDEIQGFILGVVVAMSGSFCGLAFTTWNNNKSFKEAKAERDRNKNNYYNFLQTELLPVLGNDLFSALDSLKGNINDFNSKFAKNIESFDSVFGGNIHSLKLAISDISGNIRSITDSTMVQKQFLEELKRIGYTKMAEANIRVFDKMKEVTPLLSRFVEEQNRLNNNVIDINGFASKISALLNRVSEFENGLNVLGKELRQSDILGADMLQVVKKRLTAIEEKERLVEEFTIKSTDSLREYLQKASTKIEELKRKIELDFEKAFDFNPEGNLLQNLKLLKEINSNLALMMEKEPIEDIEHRLYTPLRHIDENSTRLVKEAVDKKGEERFYKKLDDITLQLKEIKNTTTKASYEDNGRIISEIDNANIKKRSFWSFPAFRKSKKALNLSKEALTGDK